MSQYENEQGEPVTKDQLKVMALRERVAQLTAEYEDKVADLRVELTIVSQELENLQNSQNTETEGPTEGRRPENWPREAPEDR